MSATSAPLASASLAVEVRNASLIYNPDAAPVHALANIDLAVQPGEFVSLIVTQHRCMRWRISTWRFSRASSCR